MSLHCARLVRNHIKRDTNEERKVYVSIVNSVFGVEVAYPYFVDIPKRLPKMIDGVGVRYTHTVAKRPRR